MINSSRELAMVRGKPLPITRDSRQVLAQVPDDVQFRTMIAGRPGTGKSTFALKLANWLANRNYGYEVLYGNFEEALKMGTIQNKLRINKIHNENLHFLEQNNLEGFYKALDTGDYKFAFIDSLSVLYDSKSKIKDFFNTLERKYPEIPIFVIVHYTKEGQYYGSAYLEHLMDISLRAENGEITTIKNRFLRNAKPPKIRIWK